MNPQFAAAQRIGDPVRISSIEATGVLGQYDHAVRFRPDSDLVIVYGPNGVGKTKFLEIVKALSDMKVAALASLPFSSVEVVYEDGTSLRADRDTGRDDEPDGSSSGLMVSLRRRGRKTVEWKSKPVRRGTARFESFLRRETNWIPLGGGLLWQDQTDGEIAEVYDLEERYEYRSPGSQRDRLVEMPQALQEFVNSIRAHLIETQRLQTLNVPQRGPRGSSRDRVAISTISRYAAEMKSKLSEALAENSRISQQLDRTFPSRVLTQATEVEMSEEGIRTKYEQQNRLRSRLAQIALIGLDPELSLPERALTEFEISMLGLYLQDADSKLKSFESLLAKIELLERILNSRLLRKTLHVDATNGLGVAGEGASGQVSLDDLSSGEQHEIILMYGLLFNVEEDSLVMIDEPEISLHVSWQINFLNDVKQIADLAQFQFLVATHSPQIIGDWWADATSLGPENAEF